MPDDKLNPTPPDDLEQMEAMQREFALMANTAPPVLTQFYRECVAARMPPMFAFHLVQMWFAAMLAYGEVEPGDEGEGGDEGRGGCDVSRR